MASLGDAVALVRSLAAHASVAFGNARLTEQARQQVMRSREVAHDLRNPLSGVLMMLEAAAEDGESLDPEEASRAARDLRHALALVHNSLSQQAPASTAFAWHTAVATWCASLSVQARRAGVELAVGAAVPGTVTGRPTELRRAVSNLVSNAVKYTPVGGEVSVTVFVDGGRAGVVVSDQGPGLSAEQLERVFESGVQGPDPLPGHGLGLAIARRICREHGGDVSAQSAPSGARFLLWVPEADGGSGQGPV